MEFLKLTLVLVFFLNKPKDIISECKIDIAYVQYKRQCKSHTNEFAFGAQLRWS